jgi:transcriptional regulator with XRE-family HTH domain
MTSPDATEHLARLLREARAGAKISTRDMAAALGMSQARVSRMENGLAGVTPDMARAWAEAAGLTQSQTAALIRASQQGGGTHKLRGNVATQAAGLAKRQRDMGEIRQAMTSFAELNITVIPELLQMPEYATVIMRELAGLSNAADVGAAVAARMNNQPILYDESRAFSFVIAEPALHYIAGPKSLLAAQARKITDMMALPNINVSVLPYEAFAKSAILSGFIIYEVPDEPLVLVELLAGEATYTAVPDVQLYRDSFTEIRKHAVTGRKAAEMIRRAAQSETE